MAKYDQYHPDYKKLYPGIEITPEVLAVLKKSDRKMKYIEVDLKTERFVHDQKEEIAVFLPSREDSYERICEDDHAQFAADESAPEEDLLHSERIQLLRAALRKLEPDEAKLIHALFFKGLSEHKFARQTGIPQRTIHDRKKKILVKLYKLIEN